MAKLLVNLWKTLQELKDDEFKKFKWFLKQEPISAISAAQLEKADRQDTVDLMAQKYGETGAITETMKVLEEISRNDLVESLQNTCLDPKDLRPQDYDRKKAELKRVQQFAVDVTLDPDTSHPYVISCSDGKQVHLGVVKKKLLDDPERFFRCICWNGQRINQKEGTNNSKP
ncbi:zinc finger protein RFP-like [Pagrus major]|uniref:zinc finger protein RFP-like n=1 Tax=Pagrus major TaxID=143350 RepID=UPI003CC85AC0